MPIWGVPMENKYGSVEWAVQFSTILRVEWDCSWHIDNYVYGVK